MRKNGSNWQFYLAGPCFFRHSAQRFFCAKPIAFFAAADMFRLRRFGALDVSVIPVPTCLIPTIPKLRKGRSDALNLLLKLLDASRCTDGSEALEFTLSLCHVRSVSRGRDFSQPRGDSQPNFRNVIYFPVIVHTERMSGI
jgi:hypothetical protein